MSGKGENGSKFLEKSELLTKGLASSLFSGIIAGLTKKTAAFRQLFAGEIRLKKDSPEAGSHEPLAKGGFFQKNGTRKTSSTKKTPSSPSGPGPFLLAADFAGPGWCGFLFLENDDFL
ncbi:hypothetical protein [Intestinimonas butyriciproducens]|uniref:hypothetical protein n=1 Tax=Intestinimonas butyriciproducens TaxID=1297617 RepID=UPI00195A9516|nr:hypothetical protein [Intestinimonas butyriciproducens]MBM6917724.1 hypothetical protein [Intestinimonas butyriciproducens]